MKKIAVLTSLFVFGFAPAFAATDVKTPANDTPAAQVAADVKAEKAETKPAKPAKGHIAVPIVEEGKIQKGASKPEAAQAAKTVAKTTPAVADIKKPAKAEIKQTAVASAPI